MFSWDSCVERDLEVDLSTIAFFDFKHTPLASAGSHMRGNISRAAKVAIRSSVLIGRSPRPGRLPPL